LIWQNHNQGVIETCITLAVPFNIFINVKYHHVKVSGDEVTSHVFNVGLGKII
jgi:hypothetical protein